MRYVLLCACAAALLAMQACNSSSTPTAEPDYYAGLDKVGSYWVYENHELDSNGAIMSPSYLDSTWVDGVIMKAGRQATVLVSCSYDSPVPTYDTTYFSKDGSRLYVYFSLPETPLTGATTPAWVLLAHMDTTVGASWQAIPPISFPIGQTVPFNNVQVQIDSAKNDVSVTIKPDTNFVAANGVTYLSKGSTLAPVISASVSVKTGIFPLPGKLLINLGTVHPFFAVGVGLVGVRTSASDISATVLGSSTPIFSQNLGPGSLRSLLRYKLK